MPRRVLSLLGIVIATSLLASCMGGDSAPLYVGKSLAALQPALSCDDALAQVKAKTVKDMEQALSQNLQTALQAARGECGYWGYGEEDAANSAPGAGAPSPTTGTSGSRGDESAGSYSQTNNQVAGVDEADFIKNDGSYIYIVADGKLQIIDAWPAAEAHLIAAVPVEGTPTKLFVHQDRAVVYSQLGPVDNGSDGSSYYPGYYGGGECTYGYDCEFTGDGQILKVTVFDLTDKTTPQLLREIVFSGSYLNSRRIGDIVHTVVIFPEMVVPGLEYWPEELGNIWDYCWNGQTLTYSESDIIAMFVALWRKNLATIDAATISQFLPGVKDTRYVNGEGVVEEGLLEDCSGFFISQAGDGKSFLSLVSFDATQQGPLGLATIVGKPGAVYASPESLYVADRHYLSDMDRWYYDSSEGIEEATTVHKFRFHPDSIQVEYAGSGVVKGRVLNQFSMDELDGNLRIATSTGHLPSPDVHSTMAVMAEQAGGLEVVGMVDHLAPSEDIRSVRFNGEVGFVVTFKKTDPLFVFDLSDPRHPVVKGELKIPGFSTYMHLLDDHHLLTIGYDADDQGDFAWFQGIMLQIFDVTDLENPTLMHKEVIGTRGSTSDAATNHLAFNYFAPRNLLALPMVICEGGSGGTYGDVMTFSGLLVYRVTLDGGFVDLGGISHAEPSDTPDYTSCGSWWTQSNSEVKRSVIMSDDTNDYVYSVAQDLIRIANANDLANLLVSIDLTQ